MIRPIVLALVFAAGALLAACDDPNAGILSRARAGDCYTVSGRDSEGKPKLIKTECVNAPAQAPVIAPVEQAAGVCPPAAATQPRCCPESACPSVASSSGHRARGVVRRTGGGLQAPPVGNDYARVIEVERSTTYSSGSAYTVPPPHHDQSGVYGRTEYESREVESRSFSSESSSAGYSHTQGGGRRGCCERPAPPPTRRGGCCDGASNPNAPHTMTDERGYLTWSGKPRR